MGNDDPNSGRAEDASQDPAALSQDTDEQGADTSPPDGQEDPNHAPCRTKFDGKRDLID